MLRFLLPIEEEELGDNAADKIACSTGENLLRTASSNATPPLQRNFEALQWT